MLGKLSRSKCGRCGHENVRGSGLYAVVNPRWASLCQRCACDLQTGVQDRFQFWLTQVLLTLGGMMLGAALVVLVLVFLELGAGSSGSMRELLDSSQARRLAGGLLLLAAGISAGLSWRRVRQIREDLQRRTADGSDPAPARGRRSRRAGRARR